MEPWSSCWLWFRYGWWPDLDSPCDNKEEVRAILLCGAGAPSRLEGAARFERGERDRVLAVLFARMALGWCVRDDDYVFPDHSRAFLATDHHDVVHAQFRDRTLLQPFVRHMEANGYRLPLDVPDWTFRRPRWVRRLASRARPAPSDGTDTEEA